MATTTIVIDFDAITDELLELVSNDELSDEDTYELDNTVRGLHHINRIVMQPGIQRLIKGLSEVSVMVQDAVNGDDPIP